MNGDMTRRQRDPARGARTTSGRAERLQRLATAVFVSTFAGAVAASRLAPPAQRGGRPALAPALGRMPSPPVDPNHGLHAELQDLIGAAKNEAASPARSTREHHRRIAATVAEINRATSVSSFRGARLVGDVTCTAPGLPAVAYLSTGTTLIAHGHGSTTLEITGNGGASRLTFASGTLQSDIIIAINSFSQFLRVEALPSVANPDRLELRSTESNADGFVRVRQISGPHLIYAVEVGGQPVGDLKDYGSNTLRVWATDEP